MDKAKQFKTSDGTIHDDQGGAVNHALKFGLTVEPYQEKKIKVDRDGKTPDRSTNLKTKKSK